MPLPPRSSLPAQALTERALTEPAFARLDRLEMLCLDETLARPRLRVFHETSLSLPLAAGRGVVFVWDFREFKTGFRAG